jgi:hypothetical protein
MKAKILKDREVIILALQEAILTTEDLLTSMEESPEGYSEKEKEAAEVRLKEFRRLLRKKTGSPYTRAERELSRLKSVSILDLPKENREWQGNS